MRNAVLEPKQVSTIVTMAACAYQSYAQPYWLSTTSKT